MYRAIYLLLILCNSFLASADYKEVSFMQATPDEVIDAMNVSGQYSVIYFTADWCLPCQVLEEGHFRDERVINLINNGLVSVKADYSEKKDIEWYERYEVRMLPTLLIIDENGGEVDRIQNIRNTRQLYLFLHQYSQLPITDAKPLAYKLKEDKRSTQNVSNARAEIVNVSAKENRPATARLVSNAEENIYNVDVENYQSEMSIQFAAYTRYGNALKYLNALLGEGLQVSILEEYVKGKKYYKVVQRVANTKIKSLYNQYQSEGKECFIRPAKVKS